MSRYIGAASVFCMFLFVVGVVGVFGYQMLWGWPSERCERAGRWWAPEQRICGIPIEISKITGRPNGPPVKTGAATPAAAPAEPAATPVS